MVTLNKRLSFWLVKAYIKKWGKTFFLFFLIGLVVFFLLKSAIVPFMTKIFSSNQEIIGVSGSYTPSTLPSVLLSKMSRGLTKVADNGDVLPDVATSWQIQDDKTYTFHLSHSVVFSDGTPLTVKDIHYNFSNVTVIKPDNYTIVFHLQDVYAPFLVTVSRPIFKDGFVGISTYKVQDVKLNGDFIQSFTLASLTDAGQRITYQFYPTEDSVKVAFSLGEIGKMSITDLSFQNTTFPNFPNVSISKDTEYSQLVTLFYNTLDRNLNDKKLRDALSYALPDTFPEGQRAYYPISPLSFAYQETNLHTKDLAHAKLLLSASLGDDTTKYPVLTIATLPKYKKVAVIVANSWKDLGIQTKIVQVDSLPSSFQIYLGDFTVPKDPDQYTLWHSFQSNNITNFKSPRIDKILEDGRKTLAQDERVKIYSDFQKYLLDEQPATFLYFPYLYTVTRK